MDKTKKEKLMDLKEFRKQLNDVFEDVDNETKIDEQVSDEQVSFDPHQEARSQEEFEYMIDNEWGR